MRRLSILAITLVVAYAPALPASAQYSEELVVSDTTVPPGGSVNMSGDGFAANTTVTITLESTPVTLATVTSDASGAFEATVTIPADTTPGSHTLKATGEAAGGGTLVLSQSIEVGGRLAQTGQDLAAWLIIGVGLLIVGTALVGARGRRRRLSRASS